MHAPLAASFRTSSTHQPLSVAFKAAQPPITTKTTHSRSATKSTSMHLAAAQRSCPHTWRCSAQRSLAPSIVDRTCVRGRSNLAAFQGDNFSEEILKKYGISSGSGDNKPARPSNAASGSLARGAAPSNGGWGVFTLLALNVALFICDHVLHAPWAPALYLHHSHPAWWQWMTHSFMHANWQHLSANLFNLCVFGKLVEETEGALGVVFTYAVTAAGAAAVSVLTQPHLSHAVSVGASGAIFGLFAVSVLTRLSWDPRRLLEAAILGNFVVGQVVQEARSQVSGGAMLGTLNIGHMAHLGGALAGVLLVMLLLHRLPAGESE